MSDVALYCVRCHPAGCGNARTQSSPCTPRHFNPTISPPLSNMAHPLDTIRQLRPSDYWCRANMAHIIHSKPDYGLACRNKPFRAFELFPYRSNAEADLGGMAGVSISSAAVELVRQRCLSISRARDMLSLSPSPSLSPSFPLSLSCSASPPLCPPPRSRVGA